jgi:heterodisulfide reductase subunit A
MDRQLRGESLDVPFDVRPGESDKDAVLARNEGVTHKEPSATLEQPARERIRSFEPYEGVFSEEEARAAANRCLDCGGCCECHECVHACPVGCIHFDMLPEQHEYRVGTVVVSTGYEILDPARNRLLGYGRFPNVISGPQMDRLLAPTRPFNGVLRPSDGKEPDNIAVVLCNGSRDHTVCNRLCCRVGCMYSAKHAQLIMGALPLADVTIYYIDIRAFGKGYDEFFEQSKAMGVQYVKGKVAKIEEKENGNLLVHYEDMADGGIKTMEHDLAVLTVGLVPNTEPLRLFKPGELEADEFSYVREMDSVSEPGKTNIDGLYVAGTVVGGADIPDTVLHAGAAASQAAGYLERLKSTWGEGPAQGDSSTHVCACGLNPTD